MTRYADGPVGSPFDFSLCQPYDSTELPEQLLVAEDVRLASLPEYPLLLASKLGVTLRSGGLPDGGLIVSLALYEMNDAAEKVAMQLRENMGPEPADLDYLRRFLALPPEADEHQISLRFVQRAIYLSIIRTAIARRSTIRDALQIRYGARQGIPPVDDDHSHFN